MAPTYSAAILNQFGFPHLSELGVCGAPELGKSTGSRLAFTLNQALLPIYTSPLVKLVSMYGRRTEAAVDEYRTGRELLLDYVEALPKPHHKLATILRSVTHFEHCVGLTVQASLFRFRLETMDGTRNPVVGDIERRLKSIWSRAKHFDEDILVADAVDAITAPVWLTANGIFAAVKDKPQLAVSVTWAELHGLLLSYQEEVIYYFETIFKDVAEER